MSKTSTAAATLTCGILLSLPTVSLGQAPQRTPILTTPHFAIYSDFETAANAAGFRLPNDLWHVVLFYTTGEAVRQILDERGPAGYTPMLYGIFGRGSWVEYRQALESSWRPYIDGKEPLAEAAASLIAAPQKSPGR